MMIDSPQAGTSETSNIQGMQQFELECASRGYHVYRDVWRPVRGEILEIENDYGNVHDPFALSLNAHLNRRRLAMYDIVGHIPREISRFCYYFLNYGGSLHARVRDTQHRRSPIPKGGLEIPILLIIKKNEADSRVFEKMKELIEEYYMEPEKIAKTASQQEIETRDEEIDLDEYGPVEDETGNVEENVECVSLDVDTEGVETEEENEDDDVIVIN